MAMAYERENVHVANMVKGHMREAHSRRASKTGLSGFINPA